MGKKYSTPLYTPAIVVAHGQSEQLLSKHISSCLRLSVPVHHRTTSIQINGLLHELKTNFENVTQLEKNNKLTLNIEKKKILNNFKIFTLMDTDDCDETTRDKYISGTLFNGYALKEYVVPIFTTPDLEHVLFECGIIDKIFKPKEKVAGYQKVFDIPKMPYNKTREDELSALSDKLRKCQNTNLYIFIDYCIEQAKLMKV